MPRSPTRRIPVQMWTLGVLVAAYQSVITLRLLWTVFHHRQCGEDDNGNNLDGVCGGRVLPKDATEQHSHVVPQSIGG